MAGSKFINYVITYGLAALAIGIGLLLLCSSNLAVCQFSRTIIAPILLGIGGLSLIGGIYEAVAKRRYNGA